MPSRKRISFNKADKNTIDTNFIKKGGEINPIFIALLKEDKTIKGMKNIKPLKKKVVIDVAAIAKEIKEEQGELNNNVTIKGKFTIKKKSKRKDIKTAIFKSILKIITASSD